MPTAIKNNPSSFRGRHRAARPLADIGLQEQAGDYFDGTHMHVFRYWYQGNSELYLSQSREVFPRNENDSLGLWFRAEAEARTGNYDEAVKYFKQADLFETNRERIYSYQQVGENQLARSLLEKAKTLLQSEREMGAKFVNTAPTDQPIEIAAMEIAYLEGDIDRAIINLKSAMSIANDKKYIIGFKYKVLPMYKNLRQHPDWPILLAESERRAAIQREIYLKLVANKSRAIL